jgi:type I restriction enzyme S subunit
MKEKLSLPKGWEIKTIGDVCVSASSNVSQNKLANDEGDYPIYGASGLIKKVSFYHQDKPYLSIVKDGSGVGRVTKRDAYTSVIGTLQYILPTENIDLDYLNYSLMSVDFKKYVAGAAIPHIYFKDYKNEPFLWMPLPEQQRIVSILDEAFAAIAKAKANAEQNLKNAKELFESYLQGVFENGNWEKMKILDLCDGKENIVGGPFGSNLKVEHYKSSGVPILRLQNIGKGYFIDKDIKYVSEEKAKELEYHSFQSGDLALAKLGIPIGKTCIIPDYFGFGIVVADVVRIRPNRNKVHYNFLNYFLNTNLSVSQLTGNISGATRPRVNLDDVRNIIVSIPSLNEQQTIVSQLDALRAKTQKMEAVYQKKIADLEELKKSILQKAFAGELKTEKAVAV